MPRPVMIGIVGDSGSGKTTITRGIVRALGEEQVTALCTDDYHRYDRRQRAELGITPLHPDCNYIDVLAQHLRLLRGNEAVLAPTYRHQDGTFGPPVYTHPARFVISEGLLAFSTPDLCAMFDVRVFLDPPEELRRHWKVQRDCSRRGYTTDQVLTELDRREPDSEAYIRPQRRFADIVVSFLPGGTGDPDHLDARLVLRNSLPQPDLAEFIADADADGLLLVERDGEQELFVPGLIRSERAQEIEEAIWGRMHFARHLRQQTLGEFTVGTELHRSDSLALVQLLILYHVVTARAVVALGGESARPFEDATLLAES
jgi:phosphoribulokinase